MIALVLKIVGFVVGAVAIWALAGQALNYFVTHKQQRSPTHLYWLTWMREIFWCSLSVFVWPLGFIPASQTVVAGAPIVLLHGYLSNRSCMWILAWRLRQKGYQNIVALNFWPPFSSMEVLAHDLNAKIRALAQTSKDVVVIAHSMGGLVARRALSQDPSLPISKIITLGTPHAGTLLAHTAIGENGRQMRPHSQFLRGFTGSSDLMFTVASRHDNVAIPYTAALCGSNTLLVEGVGHMSLLADRRVLEKVCDALPAPADVVIHTTCRA